MPLLGSGVLAIWNGIDPGSDAEFVEWHVREHIPERVGGPGFLRGRQYAAIEGEPAYFNFYETESPAVLTSSAYLARLNAPTEWTRRVIAHFRDTSRTVCDVAASSGVGEGGVIETIRMATTRMPVEFIEAMRREVLTPALASPGVVAVHLLQGRPADSSGKTTEKALRDQPDEIADWILLIEAVEAASLQRLRNAASGSGVLERCGVAPSYQRGLYRLQFGMTHSK